MLKIDMEMPKECISEDGWQGYCPMERIWCAQRYAPKGYTTGQIFDDMCNGRPSWCPWEEVKDDE